MPINVLFPKARDLTSNFELAKSREESLVEQVKAQELCHRELEKRKTKQRGRQKNH